MWRLRVPLRNDARLICRRAMWLLVAVARRLKPQDYREVAGLSRLAGGNLFETGATPLFTCGTLGDTAVGLAALPGLDTAAPSIDGGWTQGLR